MFRTSGLLDLGSEATLICRYFAEKIGLTGPVDSLKLGSCLESKLIHTQLVKFGILSIDTQNHFHVKIAIVVSSIKGSDRKVDWPKAKFMWNHLADLDLPEIDSCSVDVLIRMDVDEAHIRLATQTIGHQENINGNFDSILMSIDWSDPLLYLE